MANQQQVNNPKCVSTPSPSIYIAYIFLQLFCLVNTNCAQKKSPELPIHHISEAQDHNFYIYK